MQQSLKDILKWIAHSPGFSSSFLNNSVALALMVECEKHELWDELVIVEESVGLLRDDLKKAHEEWEGARLEIGKQVQML